ncbi:hypothetical protein D3C80_1356860 [compost metagenome]
MAGEAEILAHAVDHHVDATGPFEAADVDGHARVLRVVRRRSAGDAAQQVVGFKTGLEVDLVARHHADRASLRVRVASACSLDDDWRKEGSALLGGLGLLLICLLFGRRGLREGTSGGGKSKCSRASQKSQATVPVEHGPIL